MVVWFPLKNEMSRPKSNQEHPLHINAATPIQLNELQERKMGREMWTGVEGSGMALIASIIITCKRWRAGETIGCLEGASLVTLTAPSPPLRPKIASPIGPRSPSHFFQSLIYFSLRYIICSSSRLQCLIMSPLFTPLPPSFSLSAGWPNSSFYFLSIPYKSHSQTSINATMEKADVLCLSLSGLLLFGLCIRTPLSSALLL